MANGKAFNGSRSPAKLRGNAIVLVFLWVTSLALGRTAHPAAPRRDDSYEPTRPKNVVQLPKTRKELSGVHRTAWRERAAARILYLEQQADLERCRTAEDEAEQRQRENTLEGIALHLEEAGHAICARRRPFSGAAWAVVLGAAQHLVTRFVDARARETLSDVRRAPTDREPSSPGTETVPAQTGKGATHDV